MTDSKADTTIDTEPPQPEKTTKKAAGDSETNNNNDASAENTKQTDELSNAKDKAQVTATTAMSVVNVALLKHVIERGSQGHMFYHLSITFIGITLILQIIAGLIAMWIGQMKGYYKQTKEDCCADVVQNLCCCKMMSKKDWLRKEKRKKYRLKLKGDEDDCGESFTANLTGLYSSQDINEQLKPLNMTSRLIPDEEEEGRCGCCPCILTSHVTNEIDYEVMQGYEDYINEITFYELKATCAKENLKQNNAGIEEAKAELAALEKKKKSIPAERFEQKNATIKSNIDMLTVKNKAYQVTIEVHKIKAGQTIMLYEKNDEVRRIKVMKMATFWQNILNYLLYLIFVLNMFITGLLGITGPSSLGAANNNSTMP